MNKTNDFGTPIKGEFRIIRDETEFVQSGGNAKTQKMIAQANQILGAGKEYGCAVTDSLIANEADFIKKINGLKAVHVKSSMITGVQIYSDGYSHLLATNGDPDNLYDPRDIIEGQGVEFKTSRGQTMVADIRKVATKAIMANQQTERLIKDFMEAFAIMLKNIQATNLKIKTTYID